LALDPLFLATAVEAAIEAGRIQRTYFRQGVTIEKKGPIDLVTAADREVEQRFRRLISERFPAHTVLGEEAQAAQGEASSGGCRWIIDPVDGTTNFAHGLALFCVSIALEIEGRVEIGVIYDPMAEELFTAERGVGAWLNGSRLRVSSCTTVLDALLCTGFPYSVREEPTTQIEVFTSFLKQARAVRRLGSAALDLCYVAAGRFDGFWEEHLHTWDFAAGLLIVTEAGGVVSDYAGEPPRLKPGQILASNGLLHPRMLQVISSARGESSAPPALVG
jgi:myo-inositol-1(or 4)-monophosphatase